MHSMDGEFQSVEAQSEKHRVALTSLLAAVALTGTKLGIGLWTNSLGILSEAAHSGLDLLAAGITLWAVWIASRPADEGHTYGHGKIENLSAVWTEHGAHGVSRLLLLRLLRVAVGAL